MERVRSIKSLGVIFTDDLKWTNHVNTITSKASKRLYLLRQLKRADVGNVDLVDFYCSCIRLVLEYACQLFHSALPQYLVKDIECMQKRAMRIVYPDMTCNDVLINAGISILENRRKNLSCKLFDNIVSKDDHNFIKLLPSRTANRDLRKDRTFEVPISNTNRFEKSFIILYEINIINNTFLKLAVKI